MTRTTGRHPDWWVESPGEDLAADLIWSALRSGECRICGTTRWMLCEHMERRLTPLNHPAFVNQIADVVSSIRKG